MNEKKKAKCAQDELHDNVKRDSKKNNSAFPFCYFKQVSELHSRASGTWWLMSDSDEEQTNKCFTLTFGWSGLIMMIGY